MLASDVAGILDAQALAYPGFLLESADFFLNRLSLAPGYCWVARATDGGCLLGYLISYPWDQGLPPALDVPLNELPAGADHWFLHDCAVVPAAQGLGVGQALLRTAATAATENGMRRASLVSLESAVGYWLRHGYATATGFAADAAGDSAEILAEELADELAKKLAEKLAGYGPGARYLSRSIPL